MKNYARIAIINITHQKKRSWLTIVGIVIGIAAIVSLLSVAQGMSNAITDQFEKLGTQRIFVMPKGFRGPGTGSPSFTNTDVRIIERVQSVRYVTPIMTGIVQISFKKEKTFSIIFSYDSESAKVTFADLDYKIASGRNFRKNDKGSVILGSKAASNLFSRKLNLNDKITINGKVFRVIGILQEIGNSQDDNSIAVTLDSGKEIFNTNKYNFLFVMIKKGFDIEKASHDIKTALNKHRKNEDFDVFTSTEVLERMGSILGIIEMVLVGIAAISLLVGGIGIMNTMYTSVMEKTRDIGIMKAIGATNKNILSIFMFESGLLGFIGGVIGAFIGSVFAIIIGELSKYSSIPVPMKIVIDPYLIIFSIGFAVFIGLISGLLPARNASKLRPADALRYE